MRVAIIFPCVVFRGSLLPQPREIHTCGEITEPPGSGGRGSRRQAGRVEAPRFLSDTRSHSAEVLSGTAAPNTFTKFHLAQERADLPVGSISMRFRSAPLGVWPRSEQIFSGVCHCMLAMRHSICVRLAPPDRATKKMELNSGPG